MCPNAKIKPLVRSERKKFLSFCSTHLKGLSWIATTVAASGLKVEILSSLILDTAELHSLHSNGSRSTRQLPTQSSMRTIIGAAHLKISDTSPLTFRAVAFTFVNRTLTKLTKVSMVALVFGRSVFEQRKTRCRRSRKQDLALIKARILIRKNVLS